MKVYIASSEEHAGNIQEDLYIRDGYASIGVTSEISNLKDIVSMSKAADIVILKSIWGYHKDFRLFLSRISALKEKKVKLINDYPFIAWNIDKGRYLAELEPMSVIPTLSLNIKNARKPSEIDSVILRISRALGSDRLVIKPTISASGYLTGIYDTTRNNDDLISSLEANRNLDFIVQPYRPLITEGEISIILISGRPLYGVTRFPGVLATKGSTTYLDLADVPASINEIVSKLKHFFLTKFSTYPCICRIDLLRNDSDYEILETELIDPDLFFRHIPEGIRKEAISMFCGLIK